MINREEILKELDEARDEILAFEKLGLNNNDYKVLIDNYKKEFVIFRFNIVHLNQTITITHDLELMIENFMHNLRVMISKMDNIIKQNK